ncbi:MAG: CpsD/CapB family tyrosine-protein kinase [Candidatus Thiodiazotropha sp.]
MEKIKKALEKASISRSNSRSNIPSQRNTFSITPRNRVPDITYTETSKLELQIDHLRKNCIITGEDNDPVTDAYKVLRTRILQYMRENKCSSLAITSPTSGNGKTINAINLSISLSKDVNQTVLLVDFDLRNPNIGKYLTTQTLPGLSDYLDGNKTISEILFNPNIERLVVLPGNKPYTNSSEMLSSPKIQDLVHELKNYYKSRIVIFDLPPVLPCDDALAFLPYVDSFMLVVEDKKNKKEEIVRAHQLLDQDKFIGTVINKSSEEVSLYSY